MKAVVYKEPPLTHKVVVMLIDFDIVDSHTPSGHFARNFQDWNRTPIDIAQDVPWLEVYGVLPSLVFGPEGVSRGTTDCIVRNANSVNIINESREQQPDTSIDEPCKVRGPDGMTVTE